MMPATLTNARMHECTNAHTEIACDRFCSHLCKEAYQACASSSAVRRQLYELERGVCQLCQVDAHALYVRVKALPRGPERMQALMESNIKLKGRMDKMMKAPVEGDFWQADHIRCVDSLARMHAVVQVNLCLACTQIWFDRCSSNLQQLFRTALLE